MSSLMDARCTCPEVWYGTGPRPECHHEARPQP
jgi:hypothetical protein